MAARSLLTYALLILVLSFFLTAPACANPPITIVTQDGTLTKYKSLLAEFDNDPCKIKRLPYGRYNRVEIELIIIAKALRLGGMNNKIEFRVTPNARRGLEEVVTGNSIICGQQLPRGILKEKGYSEALYISDPVTRFGEFQKAIYHIPTNTKMQGITTAKELNEKSVGIIGLHWSTDCAVLHNMGITNFITAPSTPLLIKMLAAGRADWVPLLLSNEPDMVKTLEGQKLVPIKGIKFSLLESRHFFVSKRHPMGKQVFQALQKGLLQLRTQGFIHNALSASGFFSPQMDSWIMLNDEQYKKGLQQNKAEKK